MVRRIFCALLLACGWAAGPAVAEESWVRVTVLLEPGPGETVKATDTLVPGGVYSMDDADARGLAAIDEEITERVEFVARSMGELENRLRLATLVARQYSVKLVVGEDTVVPVIDLNPRIGIVLTPLRIDRDSVTCRARFLAPEVGWTSPDSTGEPITLALLDADLPLVLETFSQVTGVPILPDAGITGKVSVDLRDVPWDEALDVILAANGMGWIEEGEHLRVARLEDLGRERRVRTEGTVTLRRGERSAATLVSEGDAANPTVAIIVETIPDRPAMLAEHAGLVRAERALIDIPADDEADGSDEGVAVVRAVVTADGTLRAIRVIDAPSPVAASRLERSLEGWRFRSILDQGGRRLEAVVGFGVRLQPTRIAAKLRAVERVGVEVKAAPVAGTDDQFVITVIVTELDTGAVVAAPRITARAGDEATVRSRYTAAGSGPTQFELKVKVEEDGRGASCRWTMTQDGAVVASSAFDLEL